MDQIFSVFMTSRKTLSNFLYYFDQYLLYHYLQCDRLISKYKLGLELMMESLREVGGSDWNNFQKYMNDNYYNNEATSFVFEYIDFINRIYSYRQGGSNLSNIFLFVVLIILIVCLLFKMINRTKYYKQPMYIYNN
jgi:hypothetical protein